MYYKLQTTKTTEIELYKQPQLCRIHRVQLETLKISQADFTLRHHSKILIPDYYKGILTLQY